MFKNCNYFEVHMCKTLVTDNVDKFYLNILVLSNHSSRPSINKTRKQFWNASVNSTHPVF